MHSYKPRQHGAHNRSLHSCQPRQAYLAMRPTGNWSPALVERLTAFLPAVLPLPRPAPDILLVCC